MRENQKSKSIDFGLSRTSKFLLAFLLANYFQSNFIFRGHLSRFAVLIEETSA